jgi:hypothetical protein
MKFQSLSRVLAVAGLVLLALAGVTLAQNSADKQAAPKLVIKQLERNFGEIKKGDVAQHTFTFRNEGKADLEIKKVAPS